ncbi:hypothetical protein JTB14_011485 [Gonioctena quinquepunctata]|nr:hypothetical protein JTB14_011485 [Gonioctena quinquepunctata]
MKYREINFRNSENIAAVGISAEILPNKKTIYLVSLYVKPQTRINPREWNEFFDDIPKPCLIAGDSNAHHVAWEFDDTYGKHLLEAIEKCNLAFINNGSRTLATSQRHIAIDITLCSSDISHSFSWSTLDDPHGSDHLPIIIETYCMYSTGETKTHKIWNLKKANWSQYQTTLGTKDPPVYYHQLIDAINEAATISIPKNSTVRHSQHIPKPWWNSECDSAVNNRKGIYQIQT